MILPVARFFNLAHYIWGQGLGADERRQLDEYLIQPIDVEPGAPNWWHGDEDASTSTLAAAQALGIKVQ